MKVATSRGICRGDTWGCMDDVREHCKDNTAEGCIKQVQHDSIRFVVLDLHMSLLMGGC